MLWCCAALLLLPPQPEPVFVVANPSNVARTEVIRVSVPFPRGAHRELSRARVGDADAACVPLVRWPDGSLAVVQLHARVRLAPRERLRLTVEPRAGPCPDPARSDRGPEARWHFE